MEMAGKRRNACRIDALMLRCRKNAWQPVKRRMSRCFLITVNIKDAAFAGADEAGGRCAPGTKKAEKKRRNVFSLPLFCAISPEGDRRACTGGSQKMKQSYAMLISHIGPPETAFWLSSLRMTSISHGMSQFWGSLGSAIYTWVSLEYV